MTDNANEALNDSELTDVAGGISTATHTDIINANGDVVGDYYVNTGVIKYWPCPKCGKPMHKGKMFAKYCDPCDDYYYMEYDVKQYSGTVEQLKAESL